MNKKNQLLVVFAVGLLAGPIAAQADFNYEQIDPPGETATQVFGINDRGDVVGNIGDEFSLHGFIARKK